MKILLTDPIGVGHHLEYVSLLSEGLKSLGHQVYFFGAPALLEGLVSNSLIQDGSPFIFNETPNKFAYFRTESARARFCQQSILNSLKYNVDVCHFLCLDRFIISAMRGGILKNKSLAVCATLHWLYFLPEFSQSNVRKIKGGVDLRALRFLISHGMRAMVHSEKLAISLNELTSLEQFDYVPYPVKPYEITDTEKAIRRTQLRARLEIKPQDILLLVFGGTRFDKGADIAIKMLHLLPSQYHLLLAGKDTYFSKNYLINLASEFGVVDRLRFDNRFIPQDQVSTYFCGCDIVLIPYRKKFAGQSGPLTIAASLGKKIVAPDLPMLKETVLKYNLGWLYPVEDLVLMAQVVQDAVNAPALVTSKEFIDEHGALSFTNAVVASYSKAIL